MDLGDAVGGVSWLTVLLAAAIPFVLGALWYGPLFGKRWMTASGMTEEKVASGNMLRTFGAAFVLQLVQAVALAVFIGVEAGVWVGLVAGLFAGIGWVAAAFGVVYLFEQRPLGHFLVNAGYMVVSLAVMGSILGAWG
ncbi:MAG: DUF1761 domain-containing protein [Gemmatimonadales bacterium]|nr:MAG: DUF1761 domain-containing protein [Gemmatimonadales bacterium]